MRVDPQEIIQGLINRGVPRNAAIGLAGNMSVESGFNPGINEISPLVKGSRGGFGLYQLTGPRRRQYEAYAREKGADLASTDAQLDFLKWELDNTESRAAKAIYAAQSPEEAARLVSTKFLRPGIPHLNRRIEETRKISGGTYASAPQRAQQVTPISSASAPAASTYEQPQQQAPQRPQPPTLNANMLNVADYQTQPQNALRLSGFGADNPYGVPNA